MTGIVRARVYCGAVEAKVPFRRCLAWRNHVEGHRFLSWEQWRAQIDQTPARGQRTVKEQHDDRKV